MKRIHSTTVTLLAVFFLATLTSCSPDADDEERVLMRAGETAKTRRPNPDLATPHWDDSVISITVGRFETRQQMLDTLKESFLVHQAVEEDVLDERMTWTPPNQKYKVDIVVFTMKELKMPDDTVSEVAKKFSNLGCRPLTPEEAMEVRLHLPNQPDSATRHKMSAFFILPSEETTLLSDGVKSAYAITCVAHLNKLDQKKLERLTGHENGVLKALQKHEIESQLSEFSISTDDYDALAILSAVASEFTGQEEPYEIDYGGSTEGYPGPRFAAALIESKKRLK